MAKRKLPEGLVALGRKLKPHKITAKVTKNRLLAVQLIFAIAFLTAIGGLANVQLIRGEEFKTRAETQQLSDVTLPAQRGTIYDTNMTVLAQSASAWKISLNATKFTTLSKENQEKVYNILSSALELERSYLEERASYTSYNSVSIKTKVEKEAADKIKAFTATTYVDSENEEQSFASIIMVDEDVKRYYPYSSLASQIIGSVGTDNTGLSGLEYYYNSTLTGVDGRVISSRGNSDQDIEYKSVYEAKQGNSLVLTVDETIQRYLENALDECYQSNEYTNVTGIVMDVETGAILGMSTKNDYDLNNPYKITDSRKLDLLSQITDDKEREEATRTEMYSQWKNIAITDYYDPGSVFKVITMAAGLEENVVDYEEQYTCTGSINVAGNLYHCHNTGGHGTQNLTQGLMNSCNPFFITIGQRLGVETFYKYFEAFGFTEKTGIDLPGESEPREGDSYHGSNMSLVDLASSSFGQSFKVTPLQMITAVNAIANDGKLMQPYIVSKVLDSDGNLVSQTQPVQKRQVISQSTSEKIMESMEQVAINGTAKNAYVAGFHVGGKTGTSDKLDTGKNGQKWSSFVGVAPANDPKITVLVVVDDPTGTSGGGAVAAPVAREVIENTLTYMNVEREYNDSEKAFLDIQVPSVTDMTVDEARTKLSESNFSIRVEGSGSTVVSQMPAAGQYIPQGGVIVLYTDGDSKKIKTTVPDFTGMTVTEANYAAINAGINIRVSGNSLSGASLTAYRQSSVKGSEIEYGSTVTVYFRAMTGLSDN